MVAEQIREKLEEILDPNTVLDRKKRTIRIFDEFKDQDLAIYEEVNQGTTGPKINDFARMVGERFGKIKKSPFRKGANASLFITVGHNGQPHDLRLKGFSNLDHLRKNMQHVSFLESKSQSGYNAVVGYGPSKEDPLYLVMLNGRNEIKLEHAEDPISKDPMSQDLNEILDYIHSYSTNKDHLGPTEYIHSHLDLVALGIFTKLEESTQLSKPDKQAWAESIEQVINKIKSLVGDEPSTWVLSDAILENFVKIENGGGKGHWTAIDQGYSEKQLARWRHINDLEDNQETTDRSFYGRLEFNLGQMYYSLFSMRDPLVSVVRLFEDRIYNTASGKFNKATDIGIGKPRSGKDMPTPHNYKLSLNYALLGVLEQTMYDLARIDNDTYINLANRLIETIKQTGPLHIEGPELDYVRPSVTNQ